MELPQRIARSSAIIVATAPFDAVFGGDEKAAYSLDNLYLMIAQSKSLHRTLRLKQRRVFVESVFKIWYSKTNEFEEENMLRAQMNKKLKKFLEENYEFEELNSTTLRGEVDGYPAVVTSDSDSGKFMIQVFGQATEEEDPEEVEELLQDLRSTNGVVQVVKKEQYIEVSGNSAFSFESLSTTIEDCLDRITDYMNIEGFEAGWDTAEKFTGTYADHISMGSVYKRPTYAHMDELEQTEEYEIEESPFGTTLLSILIGCIPGVLVWVVLGLLNIYAWISGYLIIRGAVAAYEKITKRRITRKSLNLAMLISIVMSAVSEYLVFLVIVIQGQAELGLGLHLLESMEFAFMELFNTDIMLYVLRDIGIAIAFILGYYVRQKQVLPKNNRMGI